MGASTKTVETDGRRRKILHSLQNLDRLIGPQAARSVWEVSVEGLALMRSLIERFSIDCDWVGGHLTTAVKPRHERELHAEIKELRDGYGYSSVRYVPRDELRTMLGRAGTTQPIMDKAGNTVAQLKTTLFGHQLIDLREGAQVRLGRRP